MTALNQLFVVTGFAATDLDDIDSDSFVHAALNTGAMFRSEAGAKAYIEDQLKEQTEELEAFGEDVSGYALQWHTDGDKTTAWVGSEADPELLFLITRVDLATIND